MNETWWVADGQLDEDQRRVVSLPLDESQLIVGPPGSGKTNLLVLRAKYLTLAKRPNFQIVVFTRALREFIAAGADAYNVPSEKIVTSHKFFRDLLFQYGVSVAESEDFSEQRRLLVEGVSKVVHKEKLQNLYDTIILDEAHDYLPEEVELFAKLGSSLFAVADKRQKIYSGEEPFEVLDSVMNGTIELRHHYRNGLQICRFADEIGRDRVDFQGITESCNYDETERPSSVICERFTSLDDEVLAVLKRLGTQLKTYPEERIGIISPSKEAVRRAWSQLQSTEFADSVTFHGEDEVVQFGGRHRVCVSTLYAAKGLEYRALHIVGCEHFARRPLPRSLAFTAVTRAKTALCLYHSNDLLGFLDRAVAMLEPRESLPTVQQLFGDGG